MKELDKVAPYKETHQKLEYYRKKNKLTQDEVVAKLAEYGIHVSRSNISHWESGTEPKFEALCALSKIYKVSLEDFRPGRLVVETAPKEEKDYSLDDFGGDLSKLLRAVGEKIDSKCRNRIIRRSVDYFNKTNEFSDEPDQYIIDLEYIRGVLGGDEMCGIGLGAYVLPIIADDLAKLGYPVDYSSPSAIDDAGLRVALLGTKAERRRFENDFTNILVNLYDRICDRNEEGRDETTRKALDVYQTYCSSIDEQVWNSVSCKYACEFELTGKGHYELGCNDLRKLAAFLKAAEPELIWFYGIPGSISHESLDRLIGAYEKGEEIPYHIYWVDVEGEEQEIKEDDFAHDKKELVEMIRANRRNHFAILADEKVQKENPVFRELEDKLLPSASADELIKLIEANKH